MKDGDAGPQQADEPGADGSHASGVPGVVGEFTERLVPRYPPEADRRSGSAAVPEAAGEVALSPEDRAILDRWTPSSTNQICLCAGSIVCAYHQLTNLIRRLIGEPEQHP